MMDSFWIFIAICNIVIFVIFRILAFCYKRRQFLRRQRQNQLAENEPRIAFIRDPPPDYSHIQSPQVKIDVDLPTYEEAVVTSQQRQIWIFFYIFLCELHIADW